MRVRAFIGCQDLNSDQVAKTLDLTGPDLDRRMLQVASAAVARPGETPSQNRTSRLW